MGAGIHIHIFGVAFGGLQNTLFSVLLISV